MCAQDLHFGSLVSLIGENPLPIYMGIRQFSKPAGKIVLVHTEETLGQARRVKETLVREGRSEQDILFEKLQDPFNPQKVEANLMHVRRKHEAAALNYTGGTKVMSAIGYSLWHGHNDQTFYLDETNGLFHFGDGTAKSVADNLVSVEVLCKLLLDSTGLRQEVSAAGVGDSTGQLKFCKDMPVHSVELWDRILGSVTPETGRKWAALADWPASKKKCEEVSRQCRILEFVHGKWFEEYVNHFASTVGGVDKNDFVLNTFFKIDNQPFESDFILARGNRLRYISVTSSKRADLCKGKVFEAIHRARQIGGGLARVALVCLAEQNVIRNIEASVGARPGSRLQVFGIEDVRLWESNDLGSLAAFLND